MSVYSTIKQNLPANSLILHRVHLGTGEIMCIFRQGRMVKAEYFDRTGALLGATNAMLNTGFETDRRDYDTRPKDSHYINSLLVKVERGISRMDGQTFELIFGIPSTSNDRVLIGDELVRYRTKGGITNDPTRSEALTVSKSGLVYMDKRTWEIADEVRRFLDGAFRLRKGRDNYEKILTEMIEILDNCDNLDLKETFNVIVRLAKYLDDELVFLDVTPLGGLYRAAKKQTARLFMEGMKF